MKYLKKFNEAELFDDSQYIKFDERKLFNKINSLKRFVVDDLGMKWVMNDIIQPYRTKVDVSNISKDVINLLIESGIPESVVMTKLKNGAKAGSIHDKNGNWTFVSKINTNYTSISGILTDIIKKGMKYNEKSTYPIYAEIMKDPKKGLMKIKNYIKPLIRKYILTSGDDIKDLDKYTNVIKKMSKIGEKSEDKVVEYLRSKGFEILYRGGDGDLIDMVFGADIITKYSGRVFLVQVKSKIYPVDLEKLTKRYDYVHLFVDGKTMDIYSKKLQKKIDI